MPYLPLPCRRRPGEFYKDAVETGVSRERERGLGRANERHPLWYKMKHVPLLLQQQKMEQSFNPPCFIERIFLPTTASTQTAQFGEGGVLK